LRNNTAEHTRRFCSEKIKKLTTSKGEVLPLGCVFDPIGAAEGRARYFRMPVLMYKHERTEQ